MVGRTPEYLGKKIEAFDVKMAMLAVLVFPLTILVFTGDLVGVAALRHVEHLQSRAARPLRDPLRLHVRHRQQRLGVRRPHRQHALVQHDARPGDAGRPLLDDHPDAGALPAASAARSSVPPSLGTFPVTTPLFAALLVGVIVIVGALTFFPALSLGPIVEHFLMQRRDRCSDGDAHAQHRSQSIWDPHDRSHARSGDAFRKLHPRTMAKNPVMFVVEVGSVLTTLRLVQRRRHRRPGNSASSCRSPSGSGSRCCSPTSPRRWPKGAARRRPTRCARPRPRRSPTAIAPDGTLETVPAPALRKGDVVLVDGRRVHPGRRRDHRRRRLGRRSRRSPASPRR